MDRRIVIAGDTSPGGDGAWHARRVRGRMIGAKSWRGVRVYTVGHSTRTLDELISMLRSFDVSVLVDIRTIPRSRHNPQFDRQPLAAALRDRGLRYVHLPALGGLRHARKDSINAGWVNASFRGFADYMQTEGFEDGLAELRALTNSDRIALMCAEAVPWRCHRSLVGDALAARGADVEHIMGIGRSISHHMTPFARVEGPCVTYPSHSGDRHDDPRLPTRAPFHLEATVRVLQRRPTNLVEVWHRGHYLRVLSASGALVLVDVENLGTIDEPDVRYVVRHDAEVAATRTEVAQVLRKILGLDVDPEPIQRLAESEPKLRATAIALRGMRPPRFPTLFEAFANVIPFQQVSLEAGLAVLGRIVERFGTRVEVGDRCFHAFPATPAIAEARLAGLRACGLSARKAESLRAIARTIACRELTEERIDAMSTSDALRALTELPGIGPWSAGLLLLRGLGRLDVFPAGDVGVARGLSRLLGIGPRALGRLVERFDEFRGYLYFYSLGASLLDKGLVRPATPLVGHAACSPAQHGFHAFR